MRLTRAAWGSLATALMCLVVYFEDSIFLASCLALLAGNFKINIRIIYGFGYKLLILPEKIRIYLCARYSQFLVGTWQDTLELELHCTTHQQICFPCLKLFSRPNLVLTSFVCGLQKSSYLDHITSKLKSSVGKHHDTY